MTTGNFDLQQEAEYVLGMMEMYQDDKEIAGMLRMKGLSQDEVAKVMTFIKIEGYKKRVRQAKKILLIGLFITIVLGTIWLFLLNAGIYNRKDDLLSRVNAKMLITPVFYGFVLGAIQTVYGTYRFVTYSTKLKQTNTE